MQGEIIKVMIHHSETIRCLIEREKAIHQVFGFFLLGQDFVHIGKKGVFDAVIVVVVYDTPQKLDSKLRYYYERKNSIFNKKNYVHNMKKIQ